MWKNWANSILIAGILNDTGERTLIDLWNEEEERIEEIDGEKGPPEKISKKIRPANQQSLHFKQAPIIPCVYTDPESKIEKFLVVMVVYSGIAVVNVDVVTKENFDCDLCMARVYVRCPVHV